MINNNKAIIIKAGGGAEPCEVMEQEQQEMLRSLSQSQLVLVFVWDAGRIL